MNRILKKFSSCILAVVMFLGITAIVNTSSVEYTVADAATDYYADITATKGTALLGQVHDLMANTHKTYTSYSDCKNTTYVKKTDPGSSSAYVMEFYSQADISANWGSGAVGTWNREHCWCQSLSNGLWGESGGGSDMHHIRPVETRLNSTRGNDKYGKVNNRDSNKAYYKDSSGNNVAHGGYSSGGVFEPLDKVKGDVARIVMYVYTHYNTYSNVGGSTNGKANCGTLKFTNVMSASSESAAIAMLLEWNESDPVDDIERTRNEAVYAIQGNRNPFIDHPEYADAIWGDGSSTPGGDTTLTGLTLSPSTLNLTVGQTGTLTLSATPSTASKSVTWSTSDSSVATVSGGTVTANGEGTATITATSTVNSSIKATATVRVTKSGSTTPTGSTATIDISKFGSLSSSYGFQKWSSGGISGTAFIYGAQKSKMQFNNSKTSYYLASTSPSSTPITSVTVKLNEGSKDWKLLTSTSAYSELSSGNPSNGNNQGSKTVTTSGTTWTVSGKDTYFALVYEGSGVCYIDSVTVTFASSEEEKPDPSVELKGLTINRTQAEMEVGDTVKLTVAPTPSDADASVSWTSSDRSVATVSSDGTVTAIKAGTATITATSTENPSIKASCTVTVKAEEEVPPEPPVTDNAKLTAFRNAVGAIVTDGTLSQRLASINSAINAYNALSESDLSEVSEEIDILKSAIAKYCEDVNKYNGEADAADGAAWGKR